MNNKISGDEGEKEICEKVKCPNCDKPLMCLPQSYPLYDVQCTAYNFRAQVKTNNTQIHNVIRGAGWEIINKVTKAGYLVPSLIVNFKWHENGKKRQEIRFYPFIKKSSLKKYTANIKSRFRMHKMFNYDLKDIQYYILYNE